MRAGPNLPLPVPQAQGERPNLEKIPDRHQVNVRPLMRRVTGSSGLNPSAVPWQPAR